MARAARDSGKERFWRGLIALWQRSQPVTVRDFCADHDVSEASFYSWRRTLSQRDQDSSTPVDGKVEHRRFRRSDSAPTPARFVPLTIVPSAFSADLHLTLNSGHSIRIPPGFDAVTLRQLLAILQGEQPC